MEIKNKKREKGFIKITIMIIVALVILKYAYDINIIEILTTGKFKVWLDKVYNIATIGWGKYGALIMKVWNYAINLLKNLFNK